MNKKPWALMRMDFLTGLAVVLPVVISIAVMVWLFGTLAGLTDTLLFFLPKAWTHKDQGAGAVHWYWSLFSLTVALMLVGFVGALTRYYVGMKIIALVDLALLKIPLLNKIYGSLKQVNEAFSSTDTSSFKQVVLVQFPQPGMYSIGFVTSEEHAEVEAKLGEKLVGIFVPITPFLTSGCIIMLPPRDVTKLDMSVPEGIKFIMSLGSIVPDYPPRPKPASHSALRTPPSAL